MPGQSSGSGPSGAAPLPPDWLNASSLPILLVATDDILFRIHSLLRDPVFFGPGEGKKPTYRFDAASGRFGILYVGLSLEAAFVETVLRNPQLSSVRRSEIENRFCSRLTAVCDLRMVKMFDEGLSALGTDNAISTGPYEPCSRWSDALWDHPQSPDGVAYRSRHDSGQICLAIFERADLGFQSRAAQTLSSLKRDVADILDRYNKSLYDDIV